MKEAAYEMAENDVQLKNKALVSGICIGVDSADRA